MWTLQLIELCRRYLRYEGDGVRPRDIEGEECLDLEPGQGVSDHSYPWLARAIWEYAGPLMWAGSLDVSGARSWGGALSFKSARTTINFNCR